MLAEVLANALSVFTKYDCATVYLTSNRVLVVSVGEELRPEDDALVSFYGFEPVEQRHYDDPYEWCLEL